MDEDRIRQIAIRLWDTYYAEFGDKKLPRHFTALVEELHTATAPATGDYYRDREEMLRGMSPKERFTHRIMGHWPTSEEE